MRALLVIGAIVLLTVTGCSSDRILVNDAPPIDVHVVDPNPLPVSGTMTGTVTGTVAVSGLTDHDGDQAEFSPLGSQNVDEPFRLVGASFQSSNDTQFWTLANSGAASAATVNVIATLTSGTANSGYGQITSVRSGRFIFANPNKFRSLVRVPAVVVAANVRRWGAFTVSTVTPQDGFYFELSNAGVLNVVSAKGGTPTKVASGSFNGTVSTYTVDTNMHAYEIVYLVAKAQFYVDGVLIHTISPTTSVMANTLTLPVTATSVNDADGTTSGVLEFWQGTILRLGPAKSEAKSVHISSNTTTVLKIGAGSLHSIVLNNPTNNAITIYDNTSAAGTIIGIINPGASATPFDLQYNLPFFVGLCIVTAGSPDLTCIYE